VVTTSDPGIAATLVGLGDPATTAVIDLGTGDEESGPDVAVPDDPVRAPRPPARGLRGRSPER
jgi:hypothetical protein